MNVAKIQQKSDTTKQPRIFVVSTLNYGVFVFSTDYTDFTDLLYPTSIPAGHSLRYKTVFYPSLLYI